jgi:uncharacterized protein involved in exopolysaccharide biosynthesis
MNTNNQNPIQEDNEIDIDWGALFKKLLKHKKYIASVTILSGILGCVVALTSARTYTVNVIMAPEVSGNSRAASSLSSITSMLGVGNLAMGSNNDALNITLFPEICSSTSFLSKLFDVKVTPYTSPKDIQRGVKPAEPISLYDFMLGKHKPKSAFALWKEELFKKDKEEELMEDTIMTGSYFNKEQTRVIMALQKSIQANVDKKTGVTSLQIVMSDPKVAQEIADTVCKRLQETVTDYRIKKSEQDYQYYKKLANEAQLAMIEAQAKYAASVDYDRSVILQSVNSEKQRLQQEVTLTQEIYMQMKQGEEMAKARIQEEKPVFVVIQPAVLPLKPSNSRKNVVLAFTFIGFCLSAGWKLFGQEKYKEIKMLMKQSE